MQVKSKVFDETAVGKNHKIKLYMSMIIDNEVDKIWLSFQ